MINTKAFYLTIVRDRMLRVGGDLYSRLARDGRNWVDLSVRFHASDFTARRGDWVAPWPMAQEPTYAMPAYDAGFRKSFAQVSDERALQVRELMHNSGRKVALYYSGGLDSTVAAVALLKNLSAEELGNVVICTSVDGIMESPGFYRRRLRGRVRILDSARSRYDDLIARGYYTITADTGDSIFGTEQMTQLLFSYGELVDKLPHDARLRLRQLCDDPAIGEQPYERFADLIISYLGIERNPALGRWFYEKLVRNISTSGVPVYSLHDFFWWFIFNVKYLHCALRAALFYYRGDDLKAAIQQNIINWYNTADYQRWSMVNNNNGQKIRNNLSTTYKWAARQYIYEFDRDDWYLNFKLKLGSFQLLLRSNIRQHRKIFGLDTDYRLHTFAEVNVRRAVAERLRIYDEQAFDPVRVRLARSSAARSSSTSAAAAPVLAA
ncbi:MAG TPA: hypothetical protein VGJ74_06075 [Burkholderiales bacterium]